jgi:large subunit ribosomal protein L24e
MVEKRTCSFCGTVIEPGTGKLFIKKDGTVLYFCKMKCQKNMLKLGRIPRRVRWTKQYLKKS